MKPNNPHAETIRRAALPELLFKPDLALATQLPEETAEAYAVEGRFGPCLYIGGRVAVLRDHFLESLRARAVGSDLSLKELAPRKDGGS